jgi:type II secretory pathway pseudopilin PulG
MTRPRRRRNGFSLIEILMVMGGVSLLMGLCAGLLHVMLRVDRTGRSHLVETTTIGRLAQQYRRDVHAARLARPTSGGDPPAGTLELTLADDRSVSYQSHGHSIDRIEHHRGDMARRETYRLPFCERPGFVVRDDDGLSWAVLRLPRADEPGPASLRHDLQLDALVGRDHRRNDPRETSK